MIMATAIRNRVQDHRVARGWSQEELARRTGLSRTAISAIETDRVVPSTAAALALAHTFDCRVEDLFSLTKTARSGGPAWAWESTTTASAFWQATVGDATRLYPVERTFMGTLPSDGISQEGGGCTFHAQADPEQTLVLAGCDPAVGLLAAELAHTSTTRLVPFIRSSRQAVQLMHDGLVHVAGLHLQDDHAPHGNERTVREVLGPGYTLLRLGSWQEGLALEPGLGIKSIRAAVAANLRWVGREPGSGARRCLDALFRDHGLPKGYDHVARDHMAVAETIRSGWAQAGICVRIAAAEAGLDFFVVRQEDYDLCYRTDMEHDPRLQALIRAVRSRALKQSVAELPGYETSEMGVTTAVVAQRSGTVRQVRGRPR